MMTTTELNYSSDANSINNSWILQWRGESTEGYSNSLRQLEFTCAFRAEMKEYLQLSSQCKKSQEEFKTYNNGDAAEKVQFHFRDALSFSSKSIVDDENRVVEAVDDEDTKNNIYNHHPPTSQIHAYESGLQYVTITNLSSSIAALTIESIFKNTIERCSLIRTAYQIVAESSNHNDYKDLANIAIKNNAFHDLIMVDNAADETPPTWSIRLRRYGIRTTIDENSHTQTTARFGKNVRSSLRQEHGAILDMKELVQQFKGRVDLGEPMCKIYILDGLQSFFVHNDHQQQQQQQDNTNNNSDNNAMTNKLLTRVVASGPKTSIYAPKTRLCITRTPLCPIASFTLCNVAQIQSNFTILDPFAGSCATLLAAAHITSSTSTAGSGDGGGCQSVAIEISHDGHVNRTNIVRDFISRSLSPPVSIIHGDCLSNQVRQQARLAIGGTSFDVIISDPPYGIREAMSSSSLSSLVSSSIDDEESSSDNILPPPPPPLTQLFYAMGDDRRNTETSPLLKVGGRLVAFIPVRTKEESLEDCLPELQAREDAGLVMEFEGKEQVLSDVLSRYLVSFICVK
jgi:16S rRNA G966 N2-methylase RsmD